MINGFLRTFPLRQQLTHMTRKFIQLRRLIITQITQIYVLLNYITYT